MLPFFLQTLVLWNVITIYDTLLFLMGGVHISVCFKKKFLTNFQLIVTFYRWIQLINYYKYFITLYTINLFLANTQLIRQNTFRRPYSARVSQLVDNQDNIMLTAALRYEEFDATIQHMLLRMMDSTQHFSKKSLRLLWAWCLLGVLLMVRKIDAFPSNFNETTLVLLQKG